MLSMLNVCQNSNAETLFKMLNTFILIVREVFNFDAALVLSAIHLHTVGCVFESQPR